MTGNSRRLFLFDIDGTLITSGGAGSSAMRAAFAALWKNEDGFRAIEFSGRTDRAIFRDAFAAAGMGDGDFVTDLRRFKRAYFRRLFGTLVTCEGRVLPGVHELLDVLGGEPDVTLALGTGNFRTSAGIKLRHYGLAHHFKGGGFGDRTEDRLELIADAIRSAQRAAGHHSDVFVIGDTVHDITAAKANNAIAVGVATGTASAESLGAAGADVVLATLEEAPKALLRRSSMPMRHEQ
jgi:phosphoglycolate phosphatase